MNDIDSLAEDFKNASNEYSALQGALIEAFEDNAIMSCLIGNLNRLASAYYMSMMNIYQNGYTIDEVLKRTSVEED